MQIPLPLPWIEKRLSFNAIHAQLLACVSFRQLKMTVNRLTHIADQFALPTNTCHIGEQPVVVDDVARCLMPEDAPERYFPVCVKADGNCFPRALSLLLFGTEDHHLELRCRIVMELALNEDLYLNANIWGMEDQLLTTLASLSDHYCQSDKATLRQEILTIVKNSTDMGFWQVMAASRVLRRPLHSIYPDRGYPILRRIHNRYLIPPQVESNMSPLAVMWSRIAQDEDYDVAHFTANHFVPLFPLPETGPCEDIPACGFEKDACDDIPEVGAFYSVLWKKHVYIAQVELVDAALQMAQVNFMGEKDGGYYWPSTCDRSEEPFCNLIAKVKKMELDAVRSTNRRQLWIATF